MHTLQKGKVEFLQSCMMYDLEYFPLLNGVFSFCLSKRQNNVYVFPHLQVGDILYSTHRHTDTHTHTHTHSIQSTDVNPQNYEAEVQCCYMFTEIIRIIRDGERRCSLSDLQM